MRFYNSSLRQNEALDDRKNAATRADKAAQNEVVSRITGHDEFSNDVLIAEEKPFDNEEAIKRGQKKGSGLRLTYVYRRDMKIDYVETIEN